MIFNTFIFPLVGLGLVLWARAIVRSVVEDSREMW